jgi:hypothetical protein
VIKFRRIRSKGHEAGMGKGRDIYTRFWCVNLSESDHLEDPGVDGEVILRSIFKMFDVGHGLDEASSGNRQLVGACEYGNETSVFIKCREFLDWLKNG